MEEKSQSKHEIGTEQDQTSPNVVEGATNPTSIKSKRTSSSLTSRRSSNNSLPSIDACNLDSKADATIGNPPNNDRTVAICDVEANVENVVESDEGPRPLYSAFTKGQKRYIVFMTAIAGFFSPVSANIYFPALTTLSTHFNVSSTLINLTLTTYMIFQGLAPTFFGDFADAAGRRPAYCMSYPSDQCFDQYKYRPAASHNT
jgi:Ca2+/Na+ antiporter